MPRMFSSYTDRWLREKGFDDFVCYNYGSGLNVHRIEDDRYFESWDYSRGDLLIYDQSVPPRPGDAVIVRHGDELAIKVFEPVSHRMPVRRRTLEVKDDGSQGPELETIEVRDKSVVGVVMFDIRRRSMPAKI